MRQEITDPEGAVLSRRGSPCEPICREPRHASLAVSSATRPCNALPAMSSRFICFQTFGTS